MADDVLVSKAESAFVLTCCFRFSFSRIITERWQNLPKAGRQFYRRVAVNDQLQYKRYQHFSQASESARHTFPASTIREDATDRLNKSSGLKI